MYFSVGSTSLNTAVKKSGIYLLDSLVFQAGPAVKKGFKIIKLSKIW